MCFISFDYETTYKRTRDNTNSAKHQLPRAKDSRSIKSNRVTVIGKFESWNQEIGCKKSEFTGTSLLIGLWNWSVNRQVNKMIELLTSWWLQLQAGYQAIYDCCSMNWWFPTILSQNESKPRLRVAFHITVTFHNSWYFNAGISKFSITKVPVKLQNFQVVAFKRHSALDSMKCFDFNFTAS